MTYQIPSNAYPRYWDEPPDPIPEACIRADIMAGIEVELEDGLDPYDRDEVEGIVAEYLADLEKLAVIKGKFHKLKFHLPSLEDWDVI